MDRGLSAVGLIPPRCCHTTDYLSLSARAGLCGGVRVCGSGGASGRACGGTSERGVAAQVPMATTCSTLEHE